VRIKAVELESVARDQGPVGGVGLFYCIVTLYRRTVLRAGCAAAQDDI